MVVQYFTCAVFNFVAAENEFMYNSLMIGRLFPVIIIIIIMNWGIES